MKDSKIMLVRGVTPYTNDKDALAWVYGYGMWILSDRFGFLNQFSKWNFDNTIHPIPTPYGDGSSSEFKDIMIEEMLRIADTDKDIYISWSGGLDSTCSICAYLLAGIDIKRLHVLYLDESIEEYPLFFTFLQKSGIDLIKMSNDTVYDWYHKVSANNILIISWCGDRLFENSGIRDFPDMYKFPWHRYCANRHVSTDTMQQLYDMVRFYDLPIKTAAQLEWWLSFACTWHQSGAAFDVWKDGNASNIISPFWAPRFQNWAMANFERVGTHHPSDTRYVKWGMKDIIFEITKDEDYRHNKDKVKSWHNFFKNSNVIHPRVGIMTTDRQYVYYESDNIVSSFCDYRKEIIELSKQVLPQYRRA